MADRVIKVFFGSDGLPYQDKERSVHFPVLGNAFMGASNTTKLWFYCDQIGGGRKNAVVYGKLPNGKKGLTILGSYTEDSQLGENYYAFSLTSFYTQCKGDLMLSLGEYNGNIIEQEEDTLYELVGNTIVEMTGVIKLNISYAVVSDPSDEQIDNWQELLGALGDKADKNRVIITYATESALNSDFANYDNGQYYYCEETQSIYKNDDGTLEVVIENYSKQEIDTLLNDKVSKAHQPSKLYCTDNTSTDTNIPYGEEVAPYIIPKRDSAGNIKVPTTPTSNNDSASKSYVDTQRDTRVAKVSSGYKLYGTDELGNQITLPYDEDTEGKVVRRDENGHIYVQNPNANGQATPKQYVDNALSLKADKSDTYTKAEVDSIASSVKKDAYILVSTTTYPTLQDFLDDYTGQEEGNIYLYPMEDITGYYRYIWEKVDGNYEWVDLGTTDIDLSDYQKKLTAGVNIVISANDTISVNQNPTFNDVSANELRVDNTLYQLYVESISNDKVGMAYVNGNLSSDIRIYQGVPEITNESSNYKLSARFGTDDIDIEVKDYTNDTTETISLLETLDEKQDQLTTASVADGALTSFIGFDANGLVKKGTPSPITVDSQVTQGSNNPVSSNAVYDYAYPTTNPSGYQANVLESISINGTTITIVGKNADLPAYPTKTSLGLDNVVNVGLDNTPTQYSGNGVKSGGVYNAIEDVAEVAEGKTRNYVISDSAVSGYVNDSFNSTNDTITLTISGNKIKDIENNDIQLSALKIGDIVSITETDVPDRWVGSISGGNIVFYKLETKIDVASSVQSGNANPVSSGAVYNYAQPIIDSTHKLASDLVDDTNQSNKFVSSEEKDFVESEWEKSLNLISGNNFSGATSNVWQTLAITPTKLKAGTYTFNFDLSQASTGQGGVFLIKNTTPNIPNLDYPNLGSYQIDTYEYKTGHIITSFTLDSDYYVILGVRTRNNKNISASNYMLNEGDHAYPYQPYHGEIVHKGDMVAVHLVSIEANRNGTYSFAVKFTEYTNSDLSSMTNLKNYLYNKTTASFSGVDEFNSGLCAYDGNLIPLMGMAMRRSDSTFKWTTFYGSGGQRTLDESDFADYLVDDKVVGYIAK